MFSWCRVLSESTPFIYIYIMFLINNSHSLIAHKEKKRNIASEFSPGCATACSLELGESELGAITRPGSDL